jgi:hypothetical protein
MINTLLMIPMFLLVRTGPMLKGPTAYETWRRDMGLRIFCSIVTLGVGLSDGLYSHSYLIGAIEVWIGLSFPLRTAREGRAGARTRATETARLR